MITPVDWQFVIVSVIGILSGIGAACCTLRAIEAYVASMEAHLD